MNENGLKHLTLIERRALKEYVRRLRAEFGDVIQRVILYGSKVRGDFDFESDIDVLVVVDNLDSQRRRALTTIGIDVDLKYNVLIGDFLVDSKHLEQMAKVREPLYQDVMAEGIDLWTSKPKPSLPRKWNARKKTSILRGNSKRKNEHFWLNSEQ